MSKYDFSMFELLPPGWHTAFARDMAEEIQQVLGRQPEEVRDSFQIMDVKEKWGRMRIYVSPYIEEVEDVIDKYETIAMRTCCVCGKPVEVIKLFPLCEVCEE